MATQQRPTTCGEYRQIWRAATRYIEATLAAPISVHEVARAAFTSRRQLQRVFAAVGSTTVRVGVGLRRWPTPKGRFMIRNRLTGFDSPVYGALAFGTTARSATLTDWPGGGFIGIHGTNHPQLLPGRVSHGCIRMRNRDIRRLDRRMPVGTPLTIR